MKKYIQPEMELYLVAIDVITTSVQGGDPADNFGDDSEFSPL